MRPHAPSTRQKRHALERAIIRYVDTHKARMMVAHAAYNYMVVLVNHKFTAIQTVAPDSFQPHTRHIEIDLPVPVVLTFATSTALDGAWAKRFKTIGGKSAYVKTIRDATEALEAP